jgi:hypothetical protein
MEFCFLNCFVIPSLITIVPSLASFVIINSCLGCLCYFSYSQLFQLDNHSSCLCELMKERKQSSRQICSLLTHIPCIKLSPGCKKRLYVIFNLQKQQALYQFHSSQCHTNHSIQKLGYKTQWYKCTNKGNDLLNYGHKSNTL